MQENKKIALFPGSFNPWHSGHELILKKALKLFDFIYVVVTYNPDKNNLTDNDVNYQFIKNELKKINSTKIKVLQNKNKMTAELAKELKCEFLIRGIRNAEDFEYEKKLAYANKHLNKDLETVFFLTDFQYQGYRSILIRHQEKIKESK
ncbi:pantetheine-phosphate adenylyltransferase [Mycoplasma buteonis]|uniref:pantetheine-phosphate adenylyltransferase n=1 Tax=Mycoplasma buteonis TaxID=171280 RepID=UPI00056A5C01|nr:pantetheine-phosphate adenylyltransferase [Mycoplasma buteonis]